MTKILSICLNEDYKLVHFENICPHSHILVPPKRRRLFSRTEATSWRTNSLCFSGGMINSQMLSYLMCKCLVVTWTDGNFSTTIVAKKNWFQNGYRFSAVAENSMEFYRTESRVNGTRPLNTSVSALTSASVTAISISKTSCEDCLFLQLLSTNASRPWPH